MEGTWIIIILLVIIVIIVAVCSATRHNESSVSRRVILAEPDEHPWYENIIRHMLPNAEFIYASRLYARHEDIVIFTWQTLWEKRQLGNKGYRIFIDGEPFPLDDVSADLYITNKTLPSTLYLPFYAMSFLERKTYTVDDLLIPPSNIHRNRFCIFIHSNCNQNFLGVQYRETFFDVLEHESGLRIDSPGRCKNNISFDNLLNELGQQGDYSNWTSNVDVFTAYKFVLAIENEFIDGYITEKFINPLLAGSIPIYMGSSDIVKHFNPARFINVRDFPDMVSCAQYIIQVDNDPELYAQIQNAPIFLNNDMRTNPYLSWLQTGVAYPELVNELPAELTPCLPLLSDFDKLNRIPSHDLEDSDTIHYINLDRSPDRNQSIIDNCDGLPIKRIVAYDGKTLIKYRENFYINDIRIDVVGDVSPGEIGCYLSHISVWLSLIRTNLPYLCIIEDDAVFLEKMSVKECTLSAPEDWDILYLGYNEELCPSLVPHNLWNRAGKEWQPCLYGYIINRRAALFLLKNCWPLSLAIDNVIRKHFDTLNAYIRTPPLIVDGMVFDSTIRDYETITYRMSRLKNIPKNTPKNKPKSK